MGLRKEFIRPTDYEIGLTYSDVKSKRYMIDLDTSLLIKVRNLDAWGGKSRYIRSINSSVYFTGRYSYARFSRRPLVAPNHNPALHDYDAMLFGAGLYREKFYSANMIYGFGTREYLATGYKAEPGRRILVGRIQRRNVSGHDLYDRRIPLGGLCHGKYHAGKLYRPRNRHVAP